MFRFLSALMKIYRIPLARFETTRSRFIQILHHLSVSWKVTPLYLFYLKHLNFGQKEPVEVKFSNFWVVRWNLTKFLKSCLKLQVSFSLNFRSLLSVMRDNIVFSRYCTWFLKKEPIKVQNFRLSTAHVKFVLWKAP